MYISQCKFSTCHRSVQVTFRSIACSHLVQAPCCFRPTTLLDLPSSTAALTSSSSPLCHEPPHPPNLFGAAGILHPAQRPQPSTSFPSSPTTPAWALESLYISTSQVRVTFQRLQGQPELCAVPVEGNVTETSGQPQPSPETAADLLLLSMETKDSTVEMGIS